jgi:CRP-like cAMP-binding protein
MLSGAAETRELVELFHGGTKREYKKNEFIIRPGESPPGVFYLENGLVKSFDITKYGEENLLIIRKTGEFLGLTWAITGQDRHIIYATMAPSTVWLVSRDVFLKFLHEHPSAAMPVLDTITDMYRLHSERIMTLEYRTVRERLISFLLTTSLRFGKKLAGSQIRLEVPLKQQDIASSINATRETASRALAELERRGLLKSSQSFITLLDIPELKAYL